MRDMKKRVLGGAEQIKGRLKRSAAAALGDEPMRTKGRKQARSGQARRAASKAPSRAQGTLERASGRARKAAGRATGGRKAKARGTVKSAKGRARRSL